jgi:hypothetical protein
MDKFGIEIKECTKLAYKRSRKHGFTGKGLLDRILELA